MPECTFNVASEEIADFIELSGNRPMEELYELFQTDCIDLVNNQFVIAYRPLQDVTPISIARYGYIRLPKLYGLLDTTAQEAAGISATFDNYHLDASGKDVIIGFIDTGIDYQSPLFRHPDGTTRIIGIWDQTIPPDSPEQNPFFLYGTTYTNTQINEALASTDPLAIVPSVDSDGHGTFMAGVAAGNIAPEDSFMGAAPESMIAVVKLKPAKQYLRDFFLISSDVPVFQENDIMMGIRYFIQLAAIRSAPLVVYIGVGTNQGDHTGTSPLGLLVQDLSEGYRTVFVTGAGNETGRRHHYLGAIPAAEEYEDVELVIGEGETGFCLELWSNSPELYTVGFLSPTGVLIEPLPNMSRNETVIPFYVNNASITVYFLNVENGSGNSVIFMRFQNPIPGVWHVRVYSTVFFTGIFHMWLPMRNFILDTTYFLLPNPDTLVTDPGNSSFIMTIAAYDHITQQIYIHSSRGFSRDNAIVPIITAPGVDVYGPVPTTSSSAQTTYARRTGTSIAAAITAGAVADFLSWNVAQNNYLNLSNASIRAFLIRGAQRNPNFAYPSREWGYGTLNLYKSFQNM